MGPFFFGKKKFLIEPKNITKKTIFVIEASSYQLDYSSVFRSKYALILNITADHIERHKSIKNYVNAKFKLLKSQTRGSFAYVKKEDELITKKLNKNKFMGGVGFGVRLPLPVLQSLRIDIGWGFRKKIFNPKPSLHFAIQQKF